MLRGIFMEKLPMSSKRLAESCLERRQKKLLKQQPKKPGEYAGERAGNKIIQLLSKKNKNTKTPVATSPIENPQKELTDYEINERVNQLLSGGQMRRFI